MTPPIQHFFDAIPDAVLVVRANPPHFTYAAASDAYLRLTGRTRAEMVNRRLFELFPDNPSDPNATGVRALAESFERVIRTRAPDAMALQRYDVATAEGRFEERWWSSSNKPLFDETGAVAWILLRVEEVTGLVQLRQRGERQTELVEALQSRTEAMEGEVLGRAEEIQQANRKLQQANEELRRLDTINTAARARAEAAEARVTRTLESLTDGFFSVDREWRFTYVNRRMEEILHRPRQAILGQTLWDIFPDAWDSPFGLAYRRAMESQERVEVEAREGSADTWVLVHAHPSPDGLSVYVHDITERHRAEEALRESERRFRSIFDESMDAALLTKADGAIAFANSASARLFGCEQEELCRLSRYDFLDATDPRVVAAMEERRRTGRFHGEVPMLRRDGTRFPAEISSAVFRDARGQEWMSTFFRDISQRKAQEAEREQLLSRLDSEKSWLRAVLEHSPLGILLFEPDGTLFFNERAETVLGITRSESGSARVVNRVICPKGIPVVLEQLVVSRVLRGGETITARELRVDQPDGTQVTLLSSAAPIRDVTGAVISAVALFQDMSARMRAEETIRSREQLLSTMFELLPVGVWIADADGLLIRHNPAAERLWGGAPHVGPSEYERYKAWWAETGRPIEPQEWALARALSHGETAIGELVRIQTFDGSFKLILNSAMPLRDETGRVTGAIAVNEDVTHLQKVEEELRRAIHSRDEVLRIVAHDLRNPLTGILLHAELLARASNDEHLRNVGDQIRRAAKRMQRLVRDLLDVTRLDTGGFSLDCRSISAGSVLAEVVESQVSMASAAGIELRIDVHGDLPEIWTDPDRLLQVLENLVGNAVKFTSAPGRITIGAKPRDNELLLWVSDTGAGIPAESIPRLFDPFWQGNRADRRGTGLGLPIVKGIVEANGGRIWVESEVGVGTTFYFTVPTASRSTPAT